MSIASLNSSTVSKHPSGSSSKADALQSGDPGALGNISADTSKQEARADLHPSQFDGYEVSDPRMRLPVDRAGLASVEGSTELTAELSARRAAPGQVGRSGRTQGSGAGLNRGSNHLRSRTGRIPGGDWDHPERIVGRLTQTPGSGHAGNSEYRCGPANLFAASLMNGPASGAGFLERVAGGAGAAQLSDPQRQQMRDIAGRIRGRTATFEDLSAAQGLLYRAGNTETTAFNEAVALTSSKRLSASERGQAQQLVTFMNTPGSTLSQAQVTQLERLATKHHGQPTRLVEMRDEQRPNDPSAIYWGVRVGGKASAGNRSGFNDRELANLGGMGSGATASAGPELNRATHHPVEDLVGRLQPGQSATVRVHHRAITDANAGSAVADHFITVGRRADGTPYLYNSDPARGDHTLFTGRPGPRQPENFTRELRRYDERLAQDGDFDTPLTANHRW